MARREALHHPVDTEADLLPTSVDWHTPTRATVPQR